MIRKLLAAFSLLFLFAQNAVALESDRNQSVLVEADEVEMDFSSGTRIYRGNVSVRQGTIRIIADQIELIYKGEQLDHGIATGNPAVFRQRPDGKDHDVIGTHVVALDRRKLAIQHMERAAFPGPGPDFYIKSPPPEP